MKKYIIGMFISVIIITNVAAVDIKSVSGRLGLVIIYNGSNDGAASPIASSFGTAFDIEFKDNFFISMEPCFDIYWSHYEWTGLKAVPTEIERGSGNNAFVLAGILDIPVMFKWQIAEIFAMSFSVGTALVMRAPIAYDTQPAFAAEMKSNRLAMTKYFWEKGRWFYPSFGINLDIKLNQKLSLGLMAKTFLPVFNAWTGQKNFWDETIVQAGLAIIVRLK